MAGIELPPPSPKEKFVVKTPKLERPKPKPHKLSEKEAAWVKIMSYGHTGTGKTLALVGLLLSGLKIYVITTDVGGEGLTSVRTALRDMSREDLLENLHYVELPEYEDVELFVKDPLEISPDIYDLDLDMIVWDGFSGFQQFQLSTYIQSMDALRGKGAGEVWEARQAGLWLEQTDWGAIRNGTLKNLSRFLYLHNRKTGKVWHKYVTCLQGGKVKEDKLTGESQKTALIQGAAAGMMGPAFDVIIQMNSKDNGEGKMPTYEYRMVGSQGLLAKSRGLKFKATETADMYKVWQSICTQLGIHVGPVLVNNNSTNV